MVDRYALDGTTEIQVMLRFFDELDRLLLKSVQIGIPDPRSLNTIVFCSVLRLQVLDPELCERILKQECIQTHEPEPVKRAVVARMLKHAKEG